MAFFRNGAVNRVNLHYGVQALAQASGGVFFLAYLLRAGVSVPATLVAQAAILMLRFSIRPALLPTVKRFGLKPVLIGGALTIAMQYPLLTTVHGAGAALALVCLVGAVGDVLYWSSYHAYFASLGDAEHRGHQIGAREALAALLGIVAPLAAAAALLTAGPVWTFAGVGLIQALSVLPLLGAPGVAVADETPPGWRNPRLGVALFTADGWLMGFLSPVWQVALFVTLKESVSAYGGAMALAALVGAVGGMALGRRIDDGKGGPMVLVAYGLAAALILVRALSLKEPWLAVAANAPGGLIGALLPPALMTAVYNLAKAAPCPLRFHIALEGGWDVGCGSACLVAAALAAAGVSLSYAIVLAVIGIGASIAMLRRYYAGLAPGLRNWMREASSTAVAPP